MVLHLISSDQGTTSLSGDDYDWALFNGNTTCISIANGNTNQLACNYSGKSGPTGMFDPPNTTVYSVEGGSGNRYSAEVTATQGQQFILVVDNYSSSPTGHTIDFSYSEAAIGTLLPSHQLSGTLFQENNANCSFDSLTEGAIKGQIVKATPQGEALRSIL